MEFDLELGGISKREIIEMKKEYASNIIEQLIRLCVTLKKIVVQAASREKKTGKKNETRIIWGSQHRSVIFTRILNNSFKIKTREV